MLYVVPIMGTMENSDGAVAQPCAASRYDAPAKTE